MQADALFVTLGLRARICRYGIPELAGSFNANILPTDFEKAGESYERMRQSQGEQHRAACFAAQSRA